MECAVSIDLHVEEKTIDLEALHAADEVFMSGTTLEVLGITSIDDQPVGDGQVGPITQKLHKEYRQRACGADS